MTSAIKTNADTMAMLKALNGESDLVTIHDEHDGTITSYVKKNTSIVVFKAVQKGNEVAPWIVSMMPGLLTPR